MAKNYTLKEAANIIAEGKKKDEIMEIGRRFPLLTVSLAAVIAQANEKFLDFINYMPDHITANKINSAMKSDIEDTDEAEEDTDEAETEAPAKAKKSVKKSDEEATDSDYSAISGSKLYEMIKEAGKLKDLKAKGFGTKKADLIAYLEKNPLDGADEAEEEADKETEAAGKYDDMNAMELFKECKKRGIKAAPKKPAKFYIGLLEKDDTSKADESDTEDEDWDDEEPEEKPAKKATKKSEKKAEKKPAKKSEPVEEEADEDDEDDDWDI